MQGWSASGQTFWWQGRHGTWCRRTRERRDQGRHWPRPVGAAEEDDRGDPRAGRQVRRAGIGADEQVGPLEEGGRLRARSADRSSRGGWRAARAPRRPSASSGPPTTTTRQPSSRNRAIRAFQCAGGHRLAAVPAPRWTASSGAAEPNRPAWSQSASSLQVVGFRHGCERRSDGRRHERRPGLAWTVWRRWPRRGRVGPGLAEPVADQRRGRGRST